ncbi:MAG: DUF2225 domain-containing protein [Eubacteriales bacterium]|nr:DUF2225 domain-containing protein [Eubacteriales bacterium]
MSLEREAQILLKKSYECPVCGNKFKSLSVKTGKARRIDQGAYLRPICEGVNPTKYDAVMCPMCGYAAMARYFNEMVPAQKLKIREKIVSMFQPVTFSEDAYTYDEVLKRYKMAYLCDVTANVQESRIAYTCVKLAWVVRARIEDPDEALSEEEKEKLAAYEMECLKNAFKHFMSAFSSEDFPMCGMDEYTVSYLVAELGYGVGHYSDAQRMLGNVVGKRDISPRLKDKALDLKQAISKKLEEQEKAKEAQK